MIVVTLSLTEVDTDTVVAGTSLGILTAVVGVVTAAVVGVVTAAIVGVVMVVVTLVKCSVTDALAVVTDPVVAVFIEEL